MQSGGGDVVEGIDSDASVEGIDDTPQQGTINSGSNNGGAVPPFVVVNEANIAGIRNNAEEGVSPDEFATLVFPAADDAYLSSLQDNPEINLMSVEQFSADAFRTKIDTLFKMRRIMKDNMQRSGTHDSDPCTWNFVEAALGKSSSSVTKVAVYYFYVMCEQTPGIDAHFTPFLDNSLKGSSCSLGYASSIAGETRTPSPVAKRTKLEDRLSKIADYSKSIMEYIKDMSTTRQKEDEARKENEEIIRRNEETREKVRMERDDEEKRFARRLELAKALNNKDMLQKLMEEEAKK